MDFWQVLVVVFVANLCALGLMYAAQYRLAYTGKLPWRWSLIPGTCQRFIYIQDFWTMTFGDMLGVPLVFAAFLHTALSSLNLWQWELFAGLSLILALGFCKMCFSKSHKPDMGFPEIGKISWVGIIHLPYFGSGVAAALFDLWFIWTGELQGVPLYVGLAGAAIYAVAFILEIKCGNFDKIKYVSPVYMYSTCRRCMTIFNPGDVVMEGEICGACWLKEKRGK